MFKLTKNKKSQQIFVSLMVSILVLILVIILANPLKTEIQKATNGTYSGNLSIGYADITIPNKATFIVLDMTLFYFIGTLIAASIAFVSGRRSFTGVITAIMVFVVVSVLITPLKTLIILARDIDHLYCTNAAITVGNKLACIIVDIWLFYFVISVIAAAATFIFVTKVIKK